MKIKSNTHMHTHYTEIPLIQFTRLNMCQIIKNSELSDRTYTDLSSYW